MKNDTNDEIMNPKESDDTAFLVEVVTVKTLKSSWPQLVFLAFTEYLLLKIAIQTQGYNWFQLSPFPFQSQKTSIGG